MMDEHNKVTVLVAYQDSTLKYVEVFVLWHGGEHRVNDIITEWGDIDRWNIERSQDCAKAINLNLNAEIVLKLLEVRSGGEEDQNNPAIHM